MSIDVLVLNTAAVDLRGKFEFMYDLVGPGGLAKCETKDMPDISKEYMQKLLQRESTTPGGPGNSAPLMFKAGLDTAVHVILGTGDYDGLDAQGRYFYDVLTKNGVQMSIDTHPNLPTGTTFIYEAPDDDRGGIAYFPNANNKFNFEKAIEVVKKFKPKIVLYMYSGLSESGDANGGQDLAYFMLQCKEQDKQGSLVIADSHTLTENPEEVINSGEVIEEYKLLMPLLPTLDFFFTSSDEAKMISNTLEFGLDVNGDSFYNQFLDKLFATYANVNGTRLFGVTTSDGAYFKIRDKDSQKVESRFIVGENIDLVGAGDAFRAGFLTYIAKNIEQFREGTLNFNEAVQMGNLFAALYIKAPLTDRYSNIMPYKNMLKIVESGETYQTLDELQSALRNEAG